LHSQEIENLSIISRWPYGPCEALFTVDSLIFAGNGSALQILKLENNEFEKISEVDLRSFISDIYVNGNNVIAGTNNGITVVDITTLTQPIIKKNFFSYNFTNSVIQINDDIFYSDYYEMNVIKNFESDNHKIYKIHSVQGYSHFYIDDSVAYVTDTRDGIYTYNISDLNDIKLINYFELPNFYGIPKYFTPDRIFKYKNKLLVTAVANQYQDRGIIYLLGINSDYSLFEVSKAEVAGDWSSSCRDIIFSDTTLYSVYISDVGSGLLIYKLTESSFYIEKNYTFDEAEKLSFFGNDKILICGGTELALLDVSEINNIKRIDSYITHNPTNTILQINLNLYTGTTKGIDIFSFKNTNIERINNYYTNASVYSLLNNNNILYSGGWPSTIPNFDFSVNVFDIDNITHPQFRYGFYNEVFIRDFKKYKNFLFAVDFRSGFEIFDISNPLNPEEIYRYENHSDGGYGSLSGYDIQFKDSLFFFSSNKKTINIFQIKNGSEVSLLDSILTSGYPRSIAIKDNYLYTAQRDKGLIIYDISNLSSINQAAQFEFENWVEKIIIINNFAYLVDADGLYVLDLTVPLHPFVVGYYKINGVNNLSISGNLIFLSEGEGGFTILRNDLITSVNNDNNAPAYFSLEQNYPNPFNPKTIINYSIAKSEFVEIKIYNSLGQEIKTLVNEINQPGNHSINFNGSSLSSGVYFYRINAGSFSQTKKMILLK